MKDSATFYILTLKLIYDQFLKLENYFYHPSMITLTFEEQLLILHFPWVQRCYVSFVFVTQYCPD